MNSARPGAEKPVAVLHEEPSPALRHAALLDLQSQSQLVAALQVVRHARPILCGCALLFEFGANYGS